MIDTKFNANRNHYIAQSLAAFLFMLLAAFALDMIRGDVILRAIGASALASSTFAAFSAHETIMARSRNIVGGYFIGIVVGAALHSLLRFSTHEWHNMALHASYIITAALAVGVSVFAMSLFDVEHPPAAGLALGLVLENWNLTVVATVLLCALLLAVVKSLLRPWLVSLL